jgi:hypothetical protein
MIKMKMIGVVLMVSSIIDKKSPRPACRPEHRATDLRRRTRMKRSSLSLGRLDLFSYYFSQAFEDRHFTKREISSAILGRGTRKTVPRRAAFFPYLAMILDRQVRHRTDSPW